MRRCFRIRRIEKQLEICQFPGIEVSFFLIESCKIIFCYNKISMAQTLGDELYICSASLQHRRKGMSRSVCRKMGDIKIFSDCFKRFVALAYDTPYQLCSFHWRLTSFCMLEYEMLRLPLLPVPAPVHYGSHQRTDRGTYRLSISE